MANSVSRLTALYGGTFDPIHYGHLKPVEALAKQVSLQQVTIMPNNVPPHRPQPLANSQQRKAMVELAIAGKPLFRLDDRELQRETPSYTVETLEQLRAEIGANQPLAFIVGQDSLLNLQRWHRWETLLTLCHLLVCQRPGYALSMDTPEEQQWLDKHQTTSVEELHSLPAGRIYLAPTPLYDISATAIRQRLEQHLACDDLLPPAVAEFIHQHQLYC
ncbi:MULTISPECIES: nicotinate-nucleotide adenylyltransferase [Buttiauxella]|uniref:nicotinate-nucleotide adenylyltransferase n=1 Tax=Buttiauxella TaxID=82976 RepID=UPI000EF75D9A|nr:MULTISPECIES: nicotinate-nucleotide adenylyltransferase [unclassified Buttiauxella]AYN27143.1 nicotinate-nucleotide adenylyltransferase [Buttiauxella sp. 3AFRM03]TDN51929.1 nicotinate-nucleotide adenylyltransferase [Buttiauxella sp. JUb87]